MCSNPICDKKLAGVGLPLLFHDEKKSFLNDYRVDFAFAPSAETFALRMRLRMSGLAVDSFRPDPPERSPPRLPPPRLPPRGPPRPCAASSMALTFLMFTPALKRWFGPGVLRSPSLFGTSLICPFTPFTCAHTVVPVFPMLNSLSYSAAPLINVRAFVVRRTLSFRFYIKCCSNFFFEDLAHNFSVNRSPYLSHDNPHQRPKGSHTLLGNKVRPVRNNFLYDYLEIGPRNRWCHFRQGIGKCASRSDEPEDLGYGLFCRLPGIHCMPGIKKRLIRNFPDINTIPSQLG